MQSCWLTTSRRSGQIPAAAVCLSTQSQAQDQKGAAVLSLCLSYIHVLVMIASEDASCRHKSTQLLHLEAYHELLQPGLKVHLPSKQSSCWQFMAWVGISSWASACLMSQVLLRQNKSFCVDVRDVCQTSFLLQFVITHHRSFFSTPCKFSLDLKPLNLCQSRRWVQLTCQSSPVALLGHSRLF